MKYIIVYGISLMFIATLHAQAHSNENFFKPLPHSPNKLYRFNPPGIDTIIINPENKYKPFDTSILKLLKQELVYKDNYNHNNIYQSSPDNMYVIKPDSTLTFNMPVRR